MDEFVRLYLYRASEVYASLQAELSQKQDETANSTELSAEAMRLVKRADAPHFSNSFYRSRDAQQGRPARATDADVHQGHKAKGFVCRGERHRGQQARYAHLCLSGRQAQGRAGERA